MQQLPVHPLSSHPPPTPPYPFDAGCSIFFQNVKNLNEFS